MHKVIILIYISILLGMTACIKLKPLDPDTLGVEWQKLDQAINSAIINMHATPFELYLTTKDKFISLDKNRSLVRQSQRILLDGELNRPVLSNNAFVQFLIQNGRHLIDFHLTKIPDISRKIFLDDLTLDGDNKIEIDEQARYVGAFNDDNTEFLLGAVVNFHYIGLLFEIEYNIDFNEILNIELKRRYEFPDISEGPDQLQSIRFINSQYFVASKDGAYKIDSNLNSSRIFPESQWILDFFPWNNQLFAQGFNSFDLYNSLFDGGSWNRINVESDLREVESFGDTLLTQRALGFEWKMAIDSVHIAYDIVYPDEIENNMDNISFLGVAKFDNNFYISFKNNVYFIERIPTK